MQAKPDETHISYGEWILILANLWNLTQGPPESLRAPGQIYKMKLVVA